jgi:hypothetical protein
MRKKNLQQFANELANFELGIYANGLYDDVLYELGNVQSLLDEVAQKIEGDLFKYTPIECSSLDQYVDKSRENLRTIHSAIYNLENNMLDSTFDQYAFMLEIVNSLSSIAHKISVDIDNTNRILNEVSIDD